MGEGIDKSQAYPYDGYQVAQGDQRTAPAGAREETAMDHIKNANINDIAQAMRKGGSFMEGLSDALIHSDATNAQRILDTWHDDILELWILHGQSKKYYVDIMVEVDAMNQDDAWERAFSDGSVVHVDEPSEVK